MRAWTPLVREHVLYFEILSRLGFSFDAQPAPVASVWHLATTASAGSPPSCAYHPLARFSRPNESVFLRQLAHLQSYADLRPDRADEILDQVDDMSPYFASIAFLRLDTKPRTVALIQLAQDLALFTVMRVKHALACRRPVEYSSQVQPIIPTPGHGSLPSGHATEGFATAAVLRELLRAAGQTHLGETIYTTQLMRLASRIAINRTVAGVHFPIDSIAGALLGLTLADYFVARARVADPNKPGLKTYEAAYFDGAALSGKGGPDDDTLRDFVWSEIFDVSDGLVKFPLRLKADDIGHPCVQAFNRPGGGDNVVSLADDTPSQVLEWLWREAVAEWR